MFISVHSPFNLCVLCVKIDAQNGDIIESKEADKRALSVETAVNCRIVFQDGGFTPGFKVSDMSLAAGTESGLEAKVSDVLRLEVLKRETMPLVHTPSMSVLYFDASDDKNIYVVPKFIDQSFQINNFFYVLVEVPPEKDMQYLPGGSMILRVGGADVCAVPFARYEQCLGEYIVEFYRVQGDVQQEVQHNPRDAPPVCAILEKVKRIIGGSTETITPEEGSLLRACVAEIFPKYLLLVSIDFEDKLTPFDFFFLIVGKSNFC